MKSLRSVDIARFGDLAEEFEMLTHRECYAIIENVERFFGRRMEWEEIRLFLIEADDTLYRAKKVRQVMKGEAHMLVKIQPPVNSGGAWSVCKAEYLDANGFETGFHDRGRRRYEAMRSLWQVEQERFPAQIG